MDAVGLLLNVNRFILASGYLLTRADEARTLRLITPDCVEDLSSIEYMSSVTLKIGMLAVTPMFVSVAFTNIDSGDPLGIWTSSLLMRVIDIPRTPSPLLVTIPFPRELMFSNAAMFLILASVSPVMLKFRESVSVI